MAKITRAPQKIFGNSGNVSYFGQPGSLPAGTKVNTKDPATIQTLAAFLDGIQSIVKSGTYKLALEDLNSLFLLAFYQIAYLMQEGIGDWDSATEYYVGSLVKYGGIVYRATLDSTNQNPSTATTYWAVAFVSATTDQTVTGIKTFSGGIVIENRTSEPTTPGVGRIWIRTDL